MRVASISMSAYPAERAAIGQLPCPSASVEIAANCLPFGLRTETVTRHTVPALLGGSGFAMGSIWMRQGKPSDRPVVTPGATGTMGPTVASSD